MISHFDTPETFFYLDPPYEGSNDYGSGRIHPEEVFEIVKKIRGKFLLSYNDSPNIRRIFKGFHILSPCLQKILSGISHITLHIIAQLHH